MKKGIAKLKIRHFLRNFYPHFDSFSGGYHTQLILPPEKESKWGQKFPKNRQNLKCTTPSKKHTFSLLEVMIALSLSAILLSSIITCYYQISQKRMLAQELKKTTLPIELTRQRLTHLFAQLTSTQDPIFHTGEHPDALGSCLFFSYYQESDLNPLFCGDLTAMLYINTDRQLCLISWAPNGEPRQEVFLEQLATLRFSFFNSKDLEWESVWDSPQLIPPFFKISWGYLKNSSPMIECAFFFPQSNAQITYHNRIIQL